MAPKIRYFSSTSPRLGYVGQLISEERVLVQVLLHERIDDLVSPGLRRQGVLAPSREHHRLRDPHRPLMIQQGIRLPPRKGQVLMDVDDRVVPCLCFFLLFWRERSFSNSAGKVTGGASRRRPESHGVTGDAWLSCLSA